ALCLLLLLPRADAGERFWAVDVGHGSRRVIGERSGVGLPTGGTDPEALCEQREEDLCLLVAIARQRPDASVQFTAVNYRYPEARAGSSEARTRTLHRPAWPSSSGSDAVRASRRTPTRGLLARRPRSPRHRARRDAARAYEEPRKPTPWAPVDRGACRAAAPG